MGIFLLKRMVTLVLTLVVASIIIFIVLEILPGDPASLMLGLDAQEDTLAALRSQLGLDQPAIIRYFQWVGGLLTGDLGVSYTYDVPVSELIQERILVSFPLALLAILLSTAIALPLGVIAAAQHNKPLDLLIMGFSQLGIAIPNFWFAMLLTIVFAVFLRWLPAGGFAGWDTGFIPALTSLLLPTIALALPQAAILARVTRSSVLEILKEDYMRTAKAKGVSYWSALWGHALRNALIPVVTILGLQFSFLLAGTIIIENVFYLPGIGRLIFQAISQRDLIVVKDLIILLSASVIIINFVVDVLYALIDPRLRGNSHV